MRNTKTSDAAREQSRTIAAALLMLSGGKADPRMTKSLASAMCEDVAASEPNVLSKPDSPDAVAAMLETGGRIIGLVPLDPDWRAKPPRPKSRPAKPRTTRQPG